MTKEQKQRYKSVELLRGLLQEALTGKKFQLDCGHHVTFGKYLGNDVTIRNGKDFRIICSQCGY